MKLNYILTAVLLLAATITYSQQINKEKMDKNINSKTIVFVHGLFLNHQSWENWVSFFEEKGYTCYAPSYPLDNDTPANLWKNTPPELGKIDFEAVFNHYEKFIDSLSEKPIIIGHSMGGLIAQKLVESEKAEAAICISTAAPKGVMSTKWSFLKSNFGLLNPFKGNSVYYPTKKWFHYAFANTMDRTASDNYFEQFVTPESRNIPRGTLKKFAKINFKQSHVPLLFITGSEDHIIPSSLVKKNFKKYKKDTGTKELKIFEGQGHLICMDEKWREVAFFTLNWINDKS